jgi:orotidine-5'-phosphate decarboxylase
MDGVVASAHEIALIRSAVSDKGFLIVVPGVRPSGDEFDDQKRVAVPAEAIRAGADYIVVGRPIIRAKDPVQAARQIIEERANIFATQES